MKKWWLPFVMMVSVMMVLAGCGTGTSKDAGNKMKVVATVYPVYDLAKQIGGDRIQLELLVPPGAEPHDWEPSANNLKDIAGAKVLLYSGAGLEPVDAFLKEDVVKGVKVVDLSQGLTLLEGHHHHHHHDHDVDHKDEHHDHDVDNKHEHHDHDRDHKHEHHDHDREEDRDQDRDEEHDTDSEHEHDHGTVDPHTWLDPMNVYHQVDTVVAAFSEMDPTNKSYYEENGKKYKEELQKLDADFRQGLANIPNRHLVVSHEAFGYLAHRYGLEQMGIMGVAADAEPTPERMARIVDFVREHRVKTIYSEELISPKLAEAIAKESGAQVLVLNPIEGLTKEQVDKGYNYIKLQRENLATLLKGQQ